MEADGRRALGKSGLIALALAVSACGGNTAVDAPGTAPAVVEVAQANQPVGTRMPQDDRVDLCKAGELQWLVGKPRTEIPVPVDVVSRRVACTTCAITEDYSAYRLNIFYDKDTELVEQVRCG